jgi:hypothetical protein
MSSLFGSYQLSFDGDLSLWDLGSWDVSTVTNMEKMFSGVTTFNSELNSWDVSNVTNTSYMFNQCHNFNGSVGSWDVSSVTNMDGMFRRAVIFDRPIGRWDVSNVTDASNMFELAEKFGIYQVTQQLITCLTERLNSNKISLIGMRN